MIPYRWRWAILGIVGLLGFGAPVELGVKIGLLFGVLLIGAVIYLFRWGVRFFRAIAEDSRS